MESGKRSRRGSPPGRVGAPAIAGESAAWSNIATVIYNGGQITLGALHPLPCVAIANADYACLAMLQRRPSESVAQLLTRLDQAIATALETDKMVDEINPAPHSPRR